MEGLELICFKVISNAGDARSNFMEALKAAREGRLSEADQLVENGESALLAAHEAHTSLIQMEATGTSVPLSLLLMHAEDQMMASEVIKMTTQEIILMHKKMDRR